MNISTIFESKMLKKTFLNPTTIEITFEKPKNFDFTAGQFVQFFIETPEEELKRSYSICSTPEEEHLSLCITLVEGGKGSNYFKNLEEGDTLKFTEAKGHFLAKETDSKQIFIATGAGIAPIYSMMKSLLKRKYPHEIFLLFGVRSEENLFWQEKLEELKENYSNFNFLTTLSQAQSDNWDGEKGRVTAHIENYFDKNANFFLCGSAAMITETRKMIIDLGADAKSIHFEMF